MKKSTILTISAFVLVFALLLGVYTYNNKNAAKKRTEGDTSKGDIDIVPPPPTIPSIPNAGTGGIVSVSDTIPLDPFSGEGKTAIENQAFNILSSRSRSLNLAKQNNIYEDVFEGLNSDLTPIISSQLNKASGITSLYQLEPYRGNDSVYIDTLKNFISKGELVRSRLGRKGFGDVPGSVTQEWNDSSDLSDISGLVMQSSVNDTIKPILSTLNRSERWNDQQDGNEVIDNYKRLAENFINSHELFELAVFNEAIRILKSGGWKFLGY